MSLLQYIEELKYNKELQDCYKHYNHSLVTDGWRKFKQIAREEFWENVICLYQVGSFFECYYEDAFILSKVLNIAKTKRNNKDKYSAPMSGFGVDFLEEKVKILTENGLFVYVVTQTEDIETKKIHRELEKIYYPSKHSISWDYILSLTYDNDWFLDRLNLWSLRLERKVYSNFPQEEVCSLIDNYNVVHLVAYGNDAVSVRNLEGIPRKTPIKTVPCLNKKVSPAKVYAKSIYFDSTEIDTIEPILHKQQWSTITLNDTTLSNLEVLKTKEWERWSLLECLDFNCTPMGKRLLYRRLTEPFNNLSDIKETQNKINQLHNLWEGVLPEMRRILYSIGGDIDGVIGKIINNRLLPKDILLLINLFNSYREIIGVMGKSIERRKENKIRHFIDDFSHIFTEWATQSGIKSGNIFVSWYDKQLDEYIEAIEKIDENKSILLQKVINETSLPFSFFETTNSLLLTISGKKLPNTFSIPEWWREIKSTLTQRRFATKELDWLWSKYLLAEKYRNVYEYDLFKELRIEVLWYLPLIKEICQEVAEIDFLLSAEQLLAFWWTLPTMHKWNEIHILEGKHPMLERVAGLDIVANNVSLWGEKTYKCLTGMNMWGKTMYMKMLWIITLLAHMWFPIPAKEWYIGLVDNIYIRAWAADNFIKEQSTFRLEMEELSYIMNHYTDKSLILIDEVWRWTDIRDGYPIALAVSEDIIKHKARCIFATHFYDIAKDIQKFSNAGNIYVKIEEDWWEIRFTHKIEEWFLGDGNSYGLHIARLANIPSYIVERAEEIKREL